MMLSNTHLKRVHWAIFSSQLLSYPFCTNYIKDEAHRNAVLSLLQKLDQEPRKVDEHFAGLGSMPMGKYFEQLLFYILDKDARYDVLLKNHQIRQENRTIGEIDLIVKDTKTGEIEHWEIALKFYLQSKYSRKHSEMIGPNAADNLARKMNKLTKHQLPISTNLHDAGILDTSQISNKLLLKGQFFYHLSPIGTSRICPDQADPSHESGWWCRVSEIAKGMNESLLWTIINKPEWIGKLSYQNSHNLLEYSDLNDLLKQYFQVGSRSVLCVGLKEKNGTWEERSRGFVVADDWPHPTTTKGSLSLISL